METFGLQAPNLYDLIGFVGTSARPSRCSIELPQSTFEAALDDLVGEFALNSCKQRRIEIKNSKIFAEWAHYSLKTQLDILGYTYSAQRAVREKRASFGGDRLSKQDVQALSQFYPQLDIYHRIVSWEGDSPSFLHFRPHPPPGIKREFIDLFKPVFEPTTRSGPPTPVLKNSPPPSHFMPPEHLGSMSDHSDVGP
ncbi:hypothetical protein JCM3765_007627, partial [Sporobolomyces pararoseus]